MDLGYKKTKQSLNSTLTYTLLPYLESELDDGGILVVKEEDEALQHRLVIDDGLAVRRVLA